MSHPQTINEVFNTDHYALFVRFCEENNMVKMSDLVRCPFDRLVKETGISTGLVMRIKSMIDLYRRNHPEEFITQKTQANTEQLEEKLREFFRKNPGRVIHINEICRSVGARRNNILPILQQASWCQMVDLNSYYYR